MTRNALEQTYRPAWEQLVSWVAVVETGSVSAAAKRLSISQAGVSQHIRQLETLYGVELLDRSTRPAKPTSSGQRLLEHASSLLRQADEMSESVRSFSRSKRSIVRIGCIDSFAATIGPQLIRAFSGKMHKMRLFSGLSPALNLQFTNRQIDLLITTGELADESTVSRLPLFTEQYLVVLPASYEASRFARLSDLAHHLQFMHYSARSVIGTQIDSYLRGTDPEIERTFEFDATDPLLTLVGAGLGFAITTPLCLWQSRHLAASVKVLPLNAFSRAGKPYPLLTRSLYLASRQGELGTLPQEFRDIVRIATQDIKRQIVTSLKLDAQVLLIDQ